MSTQLERDAKREWARTAKRVYHGTCDSCGRNRDDSGRLHRVAVQRRTNKRLCLECWDAGR